MDLFEALETARAIRRFTDALVSDDEIMTCIRAATQAPSDVGTPFASVYPAVQNLMLAARGLGIGTTLTTVYRIYQDEVRAICGVPERYEIVALIPMGRPRAPFRVGRRRPAEQVTHWERFGNRSPAKA